MRKVAVDFGTTNTVVAVWREAAGAPETLYLPGLSAPLVDGLPPLIPSLVYVNNGATGDVLAGHAVRAGGYDIQGDVRYFASFKRGIGISSGGLPRTIDEAGWDDARAGEAFLSRVLAGVFEHEGYPIDELVLTVPIQSFEHYLKWLRDETTLAAGGEQQGIGRLRIVDESTAAALGYDVRTSGELVMVFDFGGGTLDISLVRMPVGDAGGGIVLERGGRMLAHSGLHHYTEEPAEARVVAKSGRVLGGDDIDHWLLDDLLARNDATRADVGDAYARLKLAVEQAKIRLSEYESAEVSVFDPDTYRTYRATFTRSQLEDLLDRHEFYGTIQRTMDKVLRSARARGIFPEDIGAVLMVGGTSQIPSVRRMVRAAFGSERVREHRPFEAVAHGALGLAVGMGLDDFIYHSYAIRHLSPITGRHEWEEIIPSGTRYPLSEPVRLTLTAHRDGQTAIELVIGEVEDNAGEISEVLFGGRAILLVKGGIEMRQVQPLNDADGARTVAHLNPPGKAGEDRIEVEFNVDQNRTLRVTITDLQTNRVLLRQTPVVELR
ncbi:MAG: Hsp70 family protein [Anaerolineae bacterium]